MPAAPRFSRIVQCGALLFCLACAALAAAQDTPYSVTNGRVDARTFLGWQIYQDVNCGLCHGDSGQGSSAADLVLRLKFISKEQFLESVIRGKGLMPPYVADRRVADNIEPLYSYLKARSDGALGAGRPQQP